MFSWGLTVVSMFAPDYHPYCDGRFDPVLLAALEAPLLAAFLLRVAQDKVQGLALSKLGSMPLLAPFILLLAPRWWWALAWAPPIWVMRCFLAQGPWLGTALLGGVVHGLWLWGLVGFGRRG